MNTGTFKLFMLLLLVIGCYLTYIGYVSARWLGYVWFEEKPGSSWLMNLYIEVPANVALQLYGIWSLWIGGLLAGAVVQLLYRSLHLQAAIILVLASIFFSALGFNTLDWMLSGAASSNRVWSLWVYGLNNVKVNSWDFYLVTVVLPLFAGGFLIGSALLSLVAEK